MLKRAVSGDIATDKMGEGFNTPLFSLYMFSLAPSFGVIPISLCARGFL